MLSGTIDLSMYGGVGVHMAAISLPVGSQGFVGIAASPTSGLAYLDPNNSSQVIYNVNGGSGSDSFSYAYADSLGAVQMQAVNVSGYVPTTTPGPGTTPMGWLPVAQPDSFQVYHDSTFNWSVNGNDFPSGATPGVTWSLVSGPTHAAQFDFTSTGAFTYKPTNLYLGQDTFTYKINGPYGSSQTVPVTLTMFNIAPVAGNDLFIYPAPGEEYVDIDVLPNDMDLDYLSIQSVTQPDDGGTAVIVGNKIRYTPPASYNNPDATTDVFASGTRFTYTVVDIVGATAVAQVQAQGRTWTPWREYSRGNDDFRENIYETGKIKVELTVNFATKKVMLKYTGTSTTNSQVGGLPEYQFYQPFLFLQPKAVEPSLTAPFTPVPAGAAGVGLAYGAAGGTLSGEIEVGSWDGNPTSLSGTAVVQMRLPLTPNGAPVIQPYPANNPMIYAEVRQNIPWNVAFETVNNQLKEKTATLEVKEVPYRVDLGTIVTPLRIIDSSHGSGMVKKVGYPAHPGLPRKDSMGSRVEKVGFAWNRGKVTPLD